MHGDLAARNVLIGESYSAKIRYISAYLYGYKKSQSTA